VLNAPTTTIIDVQGTHHRDRGLRKLRVVTRVCTLGAVALTGAFTALVARPHPTAAKITVTTRPAPVTTTPPAPPVTLPPDTFPAGGAAPSTAPAPVTAPATAPQPPPAPPQATSQPAPVTSGAS
jgi:hypothetical protein